MPSRRDLMRWMSAGALGGAGAALGCRTRPGAEPEPAEEPGPDFSIAFLTDPHVFPEKGAPEGTARAFAHAMDRARPPEVVITGGDLVFDVLETGREEADAQFDLLAEAMAPVRVPIHHAIGNHDCYGVYEESGVEESDPLYGKELFRHRLGLERTYYSFDHEGWHFVVLDTVGLEGRHYRGWIDSEQLAWLADDLADAARPTVVVGHIPLFSNYIEWIRGTGEGIPDTVTVANCHEVAKVLLEHPVKLVLAGHLHVIETFTYKGIEFANLGAVSGNWWQGLRDGFEEGYAMLDFRGEDVAWRYIDYGWEAAEDQDAAAGV